MEPEIVKAVRGKTIIKAAITGASGSGKTYGALGLAKGLSPDGRVLLIDTENGSAAYYAGDSDKPGDWSFDTIHIAAPFTPEKYLAALHTGIKAGYQVIVIDSLTHEWDATGGILDQKAQKDARGGNSYTNWNGVKQVQNGFIEQILQAPVHIIVTLRSKMEYVLELNDKGKQVPRKVGLAPISSTGIEYEFAVIFDVDQETQLASITKDITNLFKGRTVRLDEAVGKQLRAWRDSGAELAPVQRPEPTTTPVSNQAPTPTQPQPEPTPATNDQPPAPTPQPEDKQLADKTVDEIFAEIVVSDDHLKQLWSWVNSYRVNYYGLVAYMTSKGMITKPDADSPLDYLKQSAFAKLSEIFADKKRRTEFLAFLNSTYPQPAKAS
jgi:cell division septation protein DedD